MNYQLLIRQMSERSILIEWPQKIDDKILNDIIAFKLQLLEKFDGKLEGHTPAYTSLLLSYNTTIDFPEEKSNIEELYKSKSEIKNTNKEWHIPVCYDRSLGMDQENFITEEFSHEDFIVNHTSPLYRVYMIGFLPGFIYLGGLSPKLYKDRKSTPELKIPSGSIAIGGAQTGIYPIDSPGGWHIIGRTPLNLFDVNKKEPTPIKQGDYIKFYSIDKDVFDRLSQ